MKKVSGLKVYRTYLSSDDLSSEEFKKKKGFLAVDFDNIVCVSSFNSVKSNTVEVHFKGGGKGYRSKLSLCKILALSSGKLVQLSKDVLVQTDINQAAEYFYVVDGRLKIKLSCLKFSINVGKKYRDNVLTLLNEYF